MLKNSKYLVGTAFGIIISLFMIYQNTSTIHIPLLIILLISFGLGYQNPQKGWISTLAILVAILGFYFLIGPLLDVKPQDPQSARFITYISPLPVLFGGLMGAYFKNTLSK
jgi:hypothetical protein